MKIKTSEALQQPTNTAPARGEDIEMSTVDWTTAPEGATHYDEYGNFYYKAYNSTWHKYNAVDGWTSIHEEYTKELSATLEAIPHRPVALKNLTQAKIDRLNKACDQRAAHEYKLMGELVEAQAEIERLLAEVERLDQCIGELRMELSKSQERNDELCVANHNQMVKLSKIRKVINEN